jgi:thymidylate synthase ThyX
LSEVNNLGKFIYEQVNPVAPSIVIFCQANDRDQKTYPELEETVKEFLKKTNRSSVKKINPALACKSWIKEVELVEFPKDGDKLILAALLHASGNLSYKQCKGLAAKLSQENSKKIFKGAWQNMQFYDSMLREFEYANLTYNIILSAACFGQLKRHRMSTITAQSYDPNLGLTIPESIKEIGMEKYFREIVDKTNDTYEAISKKNPIAAPYILTNAHRKRVLMRVNLRELYHISRLREDKHAQWDIQNISAALSKEAKKVMPLASSLLCGKDSYNEAYQNIFGQLPSITQAVLPGARNIK